MKRLIAGTAMLLPLFANAQDVGINGAPCAFTTIADAVAALPGGDGTVYVQDSAPHLEPVEIIVDGDVVLRPGKPGCTAPSQTLTQVEAAGVHRLLRVQSGSLEVHHLSLINGAADEGGNLKLEAGTAATLFDTEVLGGSANVAGGGIFIGQGGALETRGATVIDDNHCESCIGGGVAAMPGATVIFEDDTLLGAWAPSVGNTANIGGGLHVEDGDTQLGAAVVVSRNDALVGGGIFLKGDTQLVSGADYLGNSSNAGGGAIGTVDDEAAVATIIISAGSQFIANTAIGAGAAIRADNYGAGSVLNIEGAEFIDNIGDTTGGGGIFVMSGFTAQISDTRFEGNQSATGGAIHHQADAVIIEDCEFIENEAIEGGAIYTEDVWGTGDVLDINGALFLRNTTNQNGSGGVGGALRLRAGVTRLGNVEFIENEAFSDGGAISMDNAELRIQPPPGGCTLALGCALFDGNFTVLSTKDGGAIHLGANAVAKVRRTIFENNNAGNSGSAILAVGSASLVLTGSRINNNSDGGSGAAAAIHIGGTANIGNNTIAGNTADAVRYTANASGFLFNNVVFFNGGGVTLNSAVARCNDTQDAVLPGPLNISVPPSLNPDGSMKAGSAGIDACTSGQGKALDGTARPLGAGSTPYDMGAFEQ